MTKQLTCVILYLFLPAAAMCAAEPAGQIRAQNGTLHGPSGGQSRAPPPQGYRMYRETLKTGVLAGSRQTKD